MKIRDEKIQISVNGKVTATQHLNRGYPSVVYYFENEDMAAEKAQGKTKQQAKAEELQRAIYALINAAMKQIRELDQLSPAEADTVISGLYETLSSAVEATAGAGAKLETLERRAASLFFAWRDAEYCVMKRDYEEAEQLTAICFEMDGKQINDKIPRNARTREALRSLQAIKAQAEREARRELSPKGRAIYDRLTALDEEYLALEDAQEEAEKRIEAAEKEAEAALDALALEDPEEATRIYQRCPYFEIAEGFSKYEVYLGRGTFCKRNELAQLDTPEKRAAFVIYGTMPGEADNGTAEQPGPISGGAAPADGEPVIFKGCEGVTLDGGEPVTLDGCGEPAAIE